MVAIAGLRLTNRARAAWRRMRGQGGGHVFEAPPYQGYLDERSVRHVAGWVRDLRDPRARLPIEIVLPGTPEEILAVGIAADFSPALASLDIGDARYGFNLLFARTVSEAERDRIVVRLVGSGRTVDIPRGLKTAFEPISHVAMDIVDNCNLRCPFCVFDHAPVHRTNRMDAAVFRSALRLLPYVTDGNFWLSCLHEPTLHPELLALIAMVPGEWRRRLMLTTNLAKRLPADAFAAIADSGMYKLNVSLESLRPDIYERMRKGARHGIFMANWDALLAALAMGRAAPRLRYNIMAYRSNRDEIPGLVRTLIEERMAWQVEIRATFDEPHIPETFRRAEFLDAADWRWLRGALAGWPADRVLLLAPRDEPAPRVARAAVPMPVRDVAAHSPPLRPYNVRMDWTGRMFVYGQIGTGGEQPEHYLYATAVIHELDDPIAFLLALSSNFDPTRHPAMRTGTLIS